MDKHLEIVLRKLVALMEKEQSEEDGEEIIDIIVLAQKTLDKHPELGFKIIIEKNRKFKLVPRN